jgi:hypothetical protein
VSQKQFWMLIITVTDLSPFICAQILVLTMYIVPFSFSPFPPLFLSHFLPFSIAIFIPFSIYLCSNLCLANLCLSFFPFCLYFLYLFFPLSLFLPISLFLPLSIYFSLNIFLANPCLSFSLFSSSLFLTFIFSPYLYLFLSTFNCVKILVCQSMSPAIIVRTSPSPCLPYNFCDFFLSASLIFSFSHFLPLFLSHYHPFSLSLYLPLSPFVCAQILVLPIYVFPFLSFSLSSLITFEHYICLRFACSSALFFSLSNYLPVNLFLFTLPSIFFSISF